MLDQEPSKECLDDEAAWVIAEADRIIGSQTFERIVPLSLILLRSSLSMVKENISAAKMEDVRKFIIDAIENFDED